MATITDLEKQFYELYIATPPAALNDLKYKFFLSMLAGGASFTPSIVTEAGTSRTLSAADGGTIIYCTSGSAVTITTAAGLGAGFNCTIIQAGAGKVTVAQGASTTRVSYSSLYSTMGQYAVISIVAPVADTFIVAGNLGV
jgi:hypothetical protein